VWREAGISMHIIPYPGIDNEKLVPGHNAVYEAHISVRNALREPIDLNMQTTGSDVQTKAMGSEILLNGDLMQADAKEFGGFAPMTLHKFVLTLSQPDLASEISGVSIEIRSSCEAAMGGNIYRGTITSQYQIPRAEWLIECPRVEFKPAAYASHTGKMYERMVIKTNDPNKVLPLALYNPDSRNRWDHNADDDPEAAYYVNGRLEKVQVQIRPTSMVPHGEWTTVTDGGVEHDFKCKNDIGGCILDWNIAQQKYIHYSTTREGEIVERGINKIEGEFELRARTLCAGGVPNAPLELIGSYSSETLIFNIDVTAPVAYKVTHPESATVNGGFAVGSVVFSEPINCATIKVDSVTYSGCGGGSSTSDATGVEMICSPGSDTLLVEVPHKKRMYSITFSGIEDDFENKLKHSKEGVLTVSMSAGCSASSSAHSSLGGQATGGVVPATLGMAAQTTNTDDIQQSMESMAAKLEEMSAAQTAKLEEISVAQRSSMKQMETSNTAQRSSMKQMEDSNNALHAKIEKSAEQVHLSTESATADHASPLLGLAQKRMQQAASSSDAAHDGSVFAHATALVDSLPHNAAAAFAGAVSALLIVVAVTLYMIKSRKHREQAPLLRHSQPPSAVSYGSRV